MLNCVSLSQAQIVFNHLPQTENIHNEVPLVFVQALVSVDWVARDSTNPGKLFLFLFGHCLTHNKSTSIEKASLVLRLKEVHNNKLSNDIITSLITCNYAHIHHSTNVLRMISTTTFSFTIITGPIPIATMQLDKFKMHVDKHFIMCEMQFQKESLFGTKLCYLVDHQMQCDLA